MIIALDYDDTYTAAPEIFNEVVHLFCNREAGHQVVFVTYRDKDRRQGNADIEEDAERLGLDIIYTDGKQKKELISADIWIDDKPELIPTLSSLKAEFNYEKQRRKSIKVRRYGR